MTSSYARRRISARSRGDVAAHCCCTAHAASRAATASSLVADDTAASFFSVAGLITSNTSSDELGRHELPISKPVGTFATSASTFTLIYSLLLAINALPKYNNALRLLNDRYGTRPRLLLRPFTPWMVIAWDNHQRDRQLSHNLRGCRTQEQLAALSQFGRTRH